MTGIRAFVGHSFTEDDARVIRKFTDYFDRLTNLDINFSWESAEEAEPNLLAEKVMRIISDKNVFIGFCTKKERVISSASLTKGIFRPSFLKAHERDFYWKTSDWILQEIGLAKGRGLDIILLTESGVRPPGGILGDVEYIEFDRAVPEASFSKILEMISAISPKISGTLATSSDTRLMPAEEERERETPGDEQLTTPQPEWKRRDYELAYWSLMIEGEDTVGIESIDKAYRETDDAAGDGNLNSWQAFTELSCLRLGKGGSLANLKALAKAHPDNSKILRYLAQGYNIYQDYEKAASSYEAAASKATGDTRVLTLMGLAAVEHVRSEAPAKALTIISRTKIQVEESGNGELELLKVLQEISELAKEDDATLAIMERIVELDTSDINARSSLAYKHSQCGHEDLAFFHYLNIPYQERNSITWNNLGAAFHELSFPAKSVDAYRRAKEMGNTLAMSNLTFKLISGGFLSEAQKQCDDALVIKDYHKNVGHALARLKDLPDIEEKKEAELLEKVKPKSAFYKQFGRAASRPDPSKIAERWEGPDCVLDVTLHGEVFAAVGSYERPSSRLLASGLGLVGRSTSNGNALVRFRVEYNGTLRGRAIKAHVTRSQEGATPTASPIFDSLKDETKVLMVLTDDESELRVMENPSGSDPGFYTLKRQATNA